MRVRVLSRYTQVVKQSNSVSLENPTTSSEVACKKKLAMRVWLAALPPLPKNRQIFGSPI